MGKRFAEIPDHAPRSQGSRYCPETSQGRHKKRSVVGSTLTIEGEVSGGEDRLIKVRIEGRLSLTGCSITVGREGQLKVDLLDEVPFPLTDVITSRIQPTSASSSDRSVSSFSKIPSMTFPCPANNASGPLACTLLNGAS